MRYRDQPTVEVTQRVRCDVPTAWALVTDITLPARCSPELQSVEWLGVDDGVRVGAKFLGHNHHDAMGSWRTECEVVEVVDEGDMRRWVWSVNGPEGTAATWAFEVEPSSDGVLIRQWARMGPGPSGLSAAIQARPELEGRIIARRLAEWQQGMAANLETVRATVED